MRRTTLLMLLPLAFCAQLALAEPAGKPGKMYKWVDENGVVHYSEKPVEDQAAEEVAIRPGPVLPPPEKDGPAPDPAMVARCIQFRENVRLLESGSKDIQISENGVTRPLTDAERQPQIDAARAALKGCPEPEPPAE